MKMQSLKGKPHGLQIALNHHAGHPVATVSFSCAVQLVT